MRGPYPSVATCFGMVAVGATAVAATMERRGSARSGDVVETTDLQPFTHVSYVPARSSMSSIRIESIKLVKVATKRRIVTNDYYCNQPWAEPGGSMECQRITDESPVAAYQVTYSYRGEPMASDEYGNTYFTFSVYFQPDEISPRLRRALANGKIRRVELAEFFDVTTTREHVQRIVIDQANSRFCDGNYVDGNWVRTNPKCEDNIAYRSMAMPSSYIAVRVNPSAARLETAANGEPWPK
jgi:hypothetical protein